MKLFNTLAEVYDCYGKDEIIAVTELKQIFFYAKKGVQPKWVDESCSNPGRLVAHYYKPETRFVYKKWQENRPIRNCI